MSISCAVLDIRLENRAVFSRDMNKWLNGEASCNIHLPSCCATGSFESATRCCHGNIKESFP